MADDLVSTSAELKAESFVRDLKSLESKAVHWWPDEVILRATSLSVIPRLLATQEEFLSILKLYNQTPEQIFDLLTAANFSANLFLKHLQTLSDYGGEPTQRLNKNFGTVFPSPLSGRRTLKSFFLGTEFSYVFEELPSKINLTNEKLGIDARGLTKNLPMSAIQKDMIMILLHGANSENSGGAGLEKCEIGNYLGDPDALDKFVDQRYIWVSRITNGARVNTQGQLVQSIVVEYLEKHLGKGFDVRSNGKIPVTNYNNPTGMPFDIVIEKDNSFVGVEVCFQVTTNSVIERKGALASERRRMMSEMGYGVAYVLDDAGNFQRITASSAICDNSDCTVAFGEEEFSILVEFVRSWLS